MRKELKISCVFLLALLFSILLVSCQKDDVKLVPVQEVDQTDDFETPEEPTEPIIETPVLGTTFARNSISSFIIFNGENITFNKKILIDGDTLILETEDTNLELGKKYDGILDSSTISIFRTELPIVSINTGGLGIVDEPKIANEFLLIENG